MDQQPGIYLEVDFERCTGHGRCYGVTPELFGADEAGMPVLLIDGPIPADMRASCRTAVDSCPEFAITIGRRQQRAPCERVITYLH